jgi:hypothetical protein
MQEHNENAFKITALKENFIFDDIEYRYHANNFIFGPTEEAIVEVYKKLNLAYKQYPHLKNIFDCLVSENQIRRLFILAQPGELVTTANMGDACGYFKIVKPSQRYLLNGESFQNCFIKLAVDSDIGTLLDESIHNYIYFRNVSTDPVDHLKRSKLNRWALIEALQGDYENFLNIDFRLIKSDPIEGFEFFGKMCEYKSRLERGVELGKFSALSADTVFQSEIASHLLVLKKDIADHMFPRTSSTLRQAINEMPNWRGRYITQTFSNPTADKLTILNKTHLVYMLALSDIRGKASLFPVADKIYRFNEIKLPFRIKFSNQLNPLLELGKRESNFGDTLADIRRAKRKYKAIDSKVTARQNKIPLVTKIRPLEFIPEFRCASLSLIETYAIKQSNKLNPIYRALNIRPTLLVIDFEDPRFLKKIDTLGREEFWSKRSVKKTPLDGTSKKIKIPNSILPPSARRFSSDIVIRQASNGKGTTTLPGFSGKAATKFMKCLPGLGFICQVYVEHELYLTNPEYPFIRNAGYKFAADAAVFVPVGIFALPALIASISPDMKTNRSSMWDDYYGKGNHGIDPAKFQDFAKAFITGASFVSNKISRAMIQGSDKFFEDARPALKEAKRKLEQHDVKNYSDILMLEILVNEVQAIRFQCALQEINRQYGDGIADAVSKGLIATTNTFSDIYSEIKKLIRIDELQVNWRVIYDSALMLYEFNNLMRSPYKLISGDNIFSYLLRKEGLDLSEIAKPILPQQLNGEMINDDFTQYLEYVQPTTSELVSADNNHNSQTMLDEWNRNFSIPAKALNQSTVSDGSSDSADTEHPSNKDSDAHSEDFSIPKISLPEWQFHRNGDYYQASATIELPPIAPDNDSYDVMTKAYMEYLLNPGEDHSANSDVQTSSAPTHPTQFFNQNPNESKNKKLPFSEAMKIESFTLGTGGKENHDGTLFTLRTKGGADINATLQAGTEMGGFAVAVYIGCEFGPGGVTATVSEFAKVVLSAGTALLPYCIPAAIFLSTGIYVYKMRQEEKREHLKGRLERHLYKSGQEVATFFQTTIQDLFSSPDQHSNQFNEKHIKAQNEFKQLMRDLNHRIQYAYDHRAYGCSDALIQVKQEAEQQEKIAASSIRDQKQFLSTMKIIEEQNKNTPLSELTEKFKQISAIPNKTKEEAFMAIALHQLICDRAQNADDRLEIINDNDLLQPITYIELPLSPEISNAIGPKRIAGEHGSRKITSKGADTNVKKLIDAYNNYKKLVDDRKTPAEIEKARHEFNELLNPTKEGLKTIELKKGDFETAFEYYEAIINALEHNIGLSIAEISHEIPAFKLKLAAYEKRIHLDRLQREFVETNRNLPSEALINLIAGMTSKSVLEYTEEDLVKISGLPSLILYRTYVSLSHGQFNEAQTLLEEAANHVHFPPSNIEPLPVDGTYHPTDVKLSHKWHVSRTLTRLNEKISKINECTSSDAGRREAIEILLREMRFAISDFSNRKETRRSYEDTNGHSFLTSIIGQIGHDLSVKDWDNFITLLEIKTDDLAKELDNIIKGNSLANIPNFTNVFEDFRQHADDGPDYLLKQIREGNSIPANDPNKTEGIFRAIIGEVKLCESIHALLIKREFEALELIIDKISKDEPGLDYFQLCLPRLRKHIQDNAPIGVWLEEQKMFLTNNNYESSSPILMELYNYIVGTIGNDIYTNILGGDLKAAITTLTARENNKASEWGAELLIKLEEASNRNTDINSLFAELDVLNVKQALIDERRKGFDSTKDGSATDANIIKEAQSLVEDQCIALGQARKNIYENKTKRGFHREAAEELKELAKKARAPEFADSFEYDSERSYLAHNFQGIEPTLKNIDRILDLWLNNMKDSILKNIFREIKSIGQLFVPNYLSLLVMGIYERLKMPNTTLGPWGNTISKAILPAEVPSNQVSSISLPLGIKLQTTRAFAGCLNDTWKQLCSDLMTPIKMDELRAGNLVKSLNYGSLMLLSQIGLKLSELMMQYTPIERFRPAHSRAQFRNFVYSFLNLGHSAAHSVSTAHSSYQLAKIGWEVFGMGLRTPAYAPLFAGQVIQSLLDVTLWYEHRQNASLGQAIEDPERYLTEQAMSWALLSIFGMFSLPLVATGWGLVAAVTATAATGSALIVATTETDSSIKQATGKALEKTMSNMDYFNHIKQCFLYVTQRCVYRFVSGIPSTAQLEKVMQGNEIIIAKEPAYSAPIHLGRYGSRKRKLISNQYNYFLYSRGETKNSPAKCRINNLTSDNLRLLNEYAAEEKVLSTAQNKEQNLEKIIEIASACILKFPLIAYIKRCKYLVKHEAPTDNEREEVKQSQMIIFAKKGEKYFLYYADQSTNTLETQIINNPNEIKVIFEKPGELTSISDRKMAINIAMPLVIDAQIKNRVSVITKHLKTFGGAFSEKQLPVANSAYLALFKHDIRNAFEEKKYDEVLRLTQAIQQSTLIDSSTSPCENPKSITQDASSENTNNTIKQAFINETYRFPAYRVWDFIIYYRFVVLVEFKDLLSFNREYEEFSEYIYNSAPENWREENWHFVQDALKNIVIHFLKQCVEALGRAETTKTKRKYLSEIGKQYKYCDASWDKLLDKGTVDYVETQSNLTEVAEVMEATQIKQAKKIAKSTQDNHPCVPAKSTADAPAKMQDSTTSAPKEYYAEVKGHRFTFEQVEVPANGWCTFYAAGINKPKESLKALIKHIQKPDRKREIVEHVRIAIENNFHEKGETFGLISEDGTDLVDKTKKIQSEIDRLPSGSQEHKAAYANLLEFFERSDVQTAYIKFILQDKYADQNIVTACLQMQEKYLAAFSVRDDDPTSLNYTFSDNLDITQGNVNCVLLNRNTCQLLSHYSQLIVKKTEPVPSPAPDADVPPTRPREASSSTSSITFFSPPPRPPINDVSKEVRNLETIATGNSQPPVSNLFGRNN